MIMRNFIFISPCVTNKMTEVLFLKQDHGFKFNVNIVIAIGLNIVKGFLCVK